MFFGIKLKNALFGFKISLIKSNILSEVYRAVEFKVLFFERTVEFTFESFKQKKDLIDWLKKNL